MGGLKNSIKDKILRKIHKSIYKPGHYYSAVPNPDEIEERSKEIFKSDIKTIEGIDLNSENSLLFLKDAAKYLAQYPFQPQKSTTLRYHSSNGFFAYRDGMILYLMMMNYKPKRIIEVGSGYSSALMMDVKDLYFENKELELSFIEPFPERLQSLFRSKDESNITLHKNYVQDIPIEEFKKLKENDLLFIDSSHVSKIGSDVNFLFLEILPQLESGVIIHIHDVSFPFEYPKNFVDYGIYWNEAYLLKAFLMYNSSFEILYFSDYMSKNHLESMEKIHPDYKNFNGGSSIWLRRK